MSKPGRTEFLDREGYRQRRFRDAARMLPLFAAVLMLLPLMWPRQTADHSLTSSGMYYLFGLWLIVVVIAYVLSRVLQFDAPDDEHRAKTEPKDAPNTGPGA